MSIEAEIADILLRTVPDRIDRRLLLARVDATDEGSVTVTLPDEAAPRVIPKTVGVMIAPGQTVVIVQRGRQLVALGAVSVPGQTEPGFDVDAIPDGTLVEAKLDAAVVAKLNATQVGGNANHWNATANVVINAAGTTTLASGTLLLADGITYEVCAIGTFEGYGTGGGTGQATLTLDFTSASSTSETLTVEENVNGPKLRIATTEIAGTGSAVTLALNATWVAGSVTIENAQLMAWAIPKSGF